jgi:hypothetical protein
MTLLAAKSTLLIVRLKRRLVLYLENDAGQCIQLEEAKNQIEAS